MGRLISLIVATLILLASPAFAGGGVEAGTAWSRKIITEMPCKATSECLFFTELPNIVAASCSSVSSTSTTKKYCRLLIAECVSTSSIATVWNPLTKTCDKKYVIPEQILCSTDLECPAYTSTDVYGGALVTSVSSCIQLPGSPKGYCGTEVAYAECCAYGVSEMGTCLPLAKPIVNSIDLTNVQILNGQQMDLYKFTVTNVSTSDISVKQFKLSLFWSDSGINEQLTLSHLRFYVNGTDITDQVQLMDEDGNSVEGDTGLTEEDSKLIVTWTDEDILWSGYTATYTVRGRPNGFHLNPDDPGVDSITLWLPDDSYASGPHQYLNTEEDLSPSQASIIELATGSYSGSFDGVAANFIWSDMSSYLHTYLPNISSSGDWYNGYGVQNLGLQKETWFR